MANDNDQDFEVISSYSRAQALADGVLIDVTDTAKEAGLKFPVAVTDSVYNAYIDWPENDGLQDRSGRLWDVVTMLVHAIRGVEEVVVEKPDEATVVYKLNVVPHSGQEAALVYLKAVVGPGDTPEPVITIMQLDED